MPACALCSNPTPAHKPALWPKPRCRIASNAPPANPHERLQLVCLNLASGIWSNHSANEAVLLLTFSAAAVAPGFGRLGRPGARQALARTSRETAPGHRGQG